MSQQRDQAGEGVKKALWFVGELEDFPAELCTASLPQHINTELCTPGPRWPWFIGLFHLTRARSFWKKSSTIYFAKEGLTGFKLFLKLTAQENHLLL